MTAHHSPPMAVHRSAPMASGRCLFSRAMRLTLTFCGWATLSAVHVRQPSRPLRLLRAVLCCALVVTLLAGALLPLERHTLLAWSEAVSEHSLILQTLLVLVTLRRAHRLEAVFVSLETLHGRARSRRWPGLRRLLVPCSLICLLAAAVLVLWLCFVLVPGRYHHPHYIALVFVPQALRNPTGYWCIFTFQAAVAAFTCCLAATFDVCLFIGLSAVSFHLTVAREMLDPVCDGPDSRPRSSAAWLDSTADSAAPAAVPALASARSAPVSSPSRVQVMPTNKTSVDVVLPDPYKKTPPIPAQNLETDTEDFGRGGHSDKTAAIGEVSSQPAGEAPLSTAERLAAAEDHYRETCRLLARLNSLYELPLFASFAATLAIVVSSAYASVALYKNSSVDDVGTHTKVAAYVVYIMLLMWRVIVYAVSASDVMDKNSALTESLTKMNWRTLSKADRRHRQAFLDTVKLPLNVTAMGFFTVEKSNILTMFGFIMTYFVILLQMG